MRLLDSDKHRNPQKTAFNLIKRDILSLVNLDKCLQDGVCIFSVNRTQLYSELKEIRIQTSNEVQSKQKKK